MIRGYVFGWFGGVGVGLYVAAVYRRRWLRVRQQWHRFLRDTFRKEHNDPRSQRGWDREAGREYEDA